MMSLWPHWQRPLLLILLPIFIWLIWKIWHYHELKGSWQNLIPTLFQPWLLKVGTTEGSATPKIILSLASLLALLALLGPSWQHIEQPPLKIDAPLVIVLDLTPNMLSRDIPPSRLDSAKRKVLDIIKARKDAQTAVVVYSGSAHTLVPLSDDQSTIANLLASLSPAVMPSIGNRADLGIEKALKLLTNAQQGTRGQLLLVTTGLSNQEQTAIKQLLSKQTLPLNILGIGTAQGAPIVTPEGDFLKDKNGQIILPKLDASSLQKFAYTEGGRYNSITLNDSDIQSLQLTQLKGGERHTAEAEKRTSDYWQDQGYWLLLPLLLLAALASRKGWLYCLPLLFMLQPQPAKAFEWNQLWLNKDQQAQQLLNDNNPQAAAKRFQNEQWQGYASYQAKDYPQAAKQFAKQTTPEGLYNYGNTLARQGKYQEAIAEWDKAIKAKPNFEQAITNKKIVEDLLKKQQQQNQSSKDSQQNQDNSQQQQNSGQQSNASNDKQQQQQNQQQQADNNNQPQNNQQNPAEQSQQGQSKQASNADQQQTKDSSATTTNQQQEQQQPKQKDQQQTEQASKQQTKDNQSSAKNGQIEATDEINNQEQKESLQQWIRTIPDDPSELLRRKFYYEQRYNRGNP